MFPRINDCTFTNIRLLKGITAQSPGYVTWSFKPLDLGLRHAQGTVPTPRGSIKAEWTIDPLTDKLAMKVAAPVGTTGVFIPFRAGNWTLDGERRAVGEGFVVQGGKEIQILQL